MTGEPDVVGEIHYARSRWRIARLLLGSAILIFGAGFLTFAWYVVTRLHITAGLFHVVIGLALIGAGGGISLQAIVAEYRGAQSIWWLRTTSDGFEINDRLRPPRRFRWRDIDDIVVARFAQPYEDGIERMTERVGIRYVPGHRGANPRRRRTTGADQLIEGPWGRPPEEAVRLLKSWRTSAVEL